MGYKILFFEYSQLLYLFEEIFVFNIYSFRTKSNYPKIIDGGSNIGLSIIYFKMLYPLCEIESFEPDTVLYDTLKVNILSNRIQGVNTHCIALKDRYGSDFFYKDTNVPGSLNGSLLNQYNKNKVIGVEISVMPISSLLRFDRIDLLKLDIEGSEIEVINNLCESNVISNVAQLIIEFHDFRKIESIKAIEKLVHSGYVYKQQNQNHANGKDKVLHFVKSS